MRTIVFATLVALGLGLISDDAQALPVNATPICRADTKVGGTQQVQYACVRRCNWAGRCRLICR
jgi:hypothetical protein